MGTDYIGGTAHFKCNHKNQIYGDISYSDILIESEGIRENKTFNI